MDIHFFVHKLLCWNIPELYNSGIRELSSAKCGVIHQFSYSRIVQFWYVRELVTKKWAVLVYQNCTILVSFQKCALKLTWSDFAFTMDYISQSYIRAMKENNLPYLLQLRWNHCRNSTICNTIWLSNDFQIQPQLKGLFLKGPPAQLPELSPEWPTASMQQNHCPFTASW